MPQQLNVYLAGPDVFYPAAKEKLNNKRLVLEQQGVIGHTPLDNEIDFSNPSKSAIADEIAYSNENIMKNSNVILANMENWHGSPSADIGTSFEMGFMSARFEEHPKDIMIIGYYPNGIPDDFSKRVIDKVGIGTTNKSGELIIDSMGYMIEDFDLKDNLMLIHAINKSGGKIYGSFEEAVQNINTLWQEKQKKITIAHSSAKYPVVNFSGIYSPSFFAGLVTGAVAMVIFLYVVKRLFRGTQHTSGHSAALST